MIFHAIAAYGREQKPPPSPGEGKAGQSYKNDSRGEIDTKYILSSPATVKKGHTKY